MEMHRKKDAKAVLVAVLTVAVSGASVPFVTMDVTAEENSEILLWYC